MRMSLADVLPALEQRKVTAVVLYGQNPVLMQGVVQEINACFSHETLPFDQLKTYIQDLDTPLLFGKRPDVLHLEGGGSWATSVPILSRWPTGHIVVVQATSFPAAFTKLSGIAAVACYDCTHAESLKMVKRYCLRENITLLPDAMDWCAGMTQSGQWHSVLSVLSLACEPNKPMSADAVQALFSYSLDEDALVILDGASCRFEGEKIEDPIKTLRAWQRVMLQLWQLKQLLTQHPSDQAVEMIRPMVFFKHKTRLLRAAETWSKIKITRCLGHLIQVETAVKKGILSPQILLARVLRQCGLFLLYADIADHAACSQLLGML